MNKPQAKPNVVSGAAAESVRFFVFEQQRSERLDPREAVPRLLVDGFGGEFPPGVRKKRLRTWALQVFRRLKKHGWLDTPERGVWTPTPALRDCRVRTALGKPARSARRAPPVRPSVPPPPESWGGFVQDWVFEHRQSEFGVAEIAVALVQRGFGNGAIADRLDAARAVIEQELSGLQHEGLLTFDEQSEFWRPTALLRTWPVA